MRQLIRRFCDDENHDRNILLIDMPTGTGKTHFVIDYIYEHLINDDEKKIFFITPLKKNLPYRKLEEKLEDGHEDLKKYIMVVDPISETVIKGFKNLDYQDIENIKNAIPDKYEKIEAHLQCISDAEEANVNKNIMDTLKKQFESIERDFRKAVRTELKKQAFTPKERLKLITRPEWDWVGKLYPSVYTTEKRVFFMSVDKFLVTHDTLIDNPYRFYESDFIDDSIIFIDEFDSSKDTMLKSITKSESDKIECIRMFKSILRTLRERENEHRKAYYIPSEYYLKERGETALADFADSVLLKAENISKEFHLEYAFKLKGDPQSSFIFHDFRSHNIANGKQIKIQPDKKEQVNYISFDNGDAEDTSISKMFSNLYGFFRYFEELIAAMAKSHMEVEKARGNDIAYDDAISTMLDLYDLEYDQRMFIKHAILFNSRTKWSNTKGDDDDLSIYNRGFSFYRFEDSEEHNLSSKLYLTAYSRTPEKILLTVLSKKGVKVVGISATASLPSAVGNFDFEYLKYRSEFKLYVISDGDRKRLNAHFKESISNYDNVNIEPVIIDGDCLTVESVFEDEEDRLIINNMLDSNGFKDYEQIRFLKIAKVYKEFLNRDIRSMVCFLNILSAEGTRYSNVIRDMFECLVRESKDVPDCLRITPFITLQSAKFEETKRDILDRMSSGEKVFVLTTYATVGAGQNLQYAPPKDLIPDLVRTSNYRGDRVVEKDIDAIYLDEPTNIVPRVEKDDWEALAKAIFTIEFLMERGEYSPKWAFDMIRNSFMECNGSSVPFKHKMKDKDSVRMTYARYIIQAIGRMCRTNMKSKSVYIFADKNIEKVFDFDQPIEKYGLLRNPEFDHLYGALKKNYVNVPKKRDGSERRPGDYASEVAYRYITGFLGIDWDDNRKSKWIKLRQLVLTHPTLPDGEGGPLANSLYCRLSEQDNKLHYSEEGDYGYVYLTDDGDKTVSAEAARLDKMLELPNVREMFEEKGYATSFEKNDLILSPPLFNNIYKGGLGEAVGEQILKDWGVMLCELDTKNYERFDFKINDSVFIDFKNWAGPMEKNRDKCLKEIFGKLEKVGGTRVYIINIVATGRKEKPLVRTRDNNGKEIIEVPYLFDLNKIRNHEIYKAIRKEVNL